MVNELSKLDSKLIDKIDSLPKVQCPIAHYFSPGIYLREMRLPKGTIAVGHYHKTEHFCFLMQGVLLLIGENKSPDMLTGPCIFISNPGHKIVYAASDVIIHNIHPNPDNIRDQDQLEKMFIDKSGYFDTLLKGNGHEEDRLDFETLDYKQNDNEIVIDLPLGFQTVLSVRKSEIHGKGMFTSHPFRKDEYIGPYRMLGKLTSFGRYVNHSANPNGQIRFISNGEVVIFAKKDIDGCQGDSQGEEITIDYRGLKLCHGEQLQGRQSSP